MKKVLWILILLFLLSFGIRVYYMQDTVFHHDSAVLAEAVEHTYSDGKLYQANNGRYMTVILGNIYYTTAVFLTGPQQADLSLIWLNLIAGCVCVILTFLIVLSIYKKLRMAIWTSLMLCFSPVFLSVTTYAKPHAVELMFLLLSICGLIIYKEEKLNRYILMSIVCLFFATLTRESSLLFIPLHIVIFYWVNNRKFSSFYSYSLIGLLIPVGIIFRNLIYNSLFVPNNGTVTILFSMTILNKACVDLIMNLGCIGIFLFFVGIYFAYERHERLTLFFLLLWCSYLFYFGSTSGYSPRFLILILIPYYIFISRALEKIYESAKFISILLSIGIILNMLMFIIPVLEYRQDSNSFKDYSLWLEDHVGNGLLIINDDSIFVKHYTNVETRGTTGPWINYTKEVLQNRSAYLSCDAHQYHNIVEFQKQVVENFKIVMIDSIVKENYHKASIELKPINCTLYELKMK